MPDAQYQILQGDCLEVMRGMPDESVDIIWTDPPYGHNNNNGDLIARRESALGVGKYTPGETDRPIHNDGPEDMRRVVDGMLVEAARVLKKDCCCCCCCCCGGGPKPTFAWVADRMDKKGLSFFHAVVWDKGGLGMGWRYRRNYEMVMVAHRKGGRLKWEYPAHDKKTANVVRIPKIIPGADDHPTPKPVELVYHFLELHAKPGDVVLDPFMGHGTTGEAALLFGCRFIGVELDAQHFQSAKARLENITAQPDLFTLAPSPLHVFAES